ncbi:CLUMA_CG012551, isoform A [Clunio marinus]|uniref:CLUMA_CG012551, isoform A n=1 Tax=Clunio marinus TaxID=568069 RepID=A0A1J1IL78_9DIPT|nr:CLUMA_CG012551, isoform A [Clunio marinus]
METEFNRHHGAKWKEFQINDPIYYQLHSTNDKWKWVAGKITKKIGLVDYEAEIEGTFGERKVKAHANQLKFRHTKNELKELFDVPEDPLNFSDDEIEPIIIPQQLPEIQQNLNNSSQINHDNISNDSTNFEDALDNDEVNEDDSSNQNDDSNGNGNITPRYPNPLRLLITSSSQQK